jgi:hypothetical protein
MGSVVLAGATSGSTTLTPTDAVTATITLPSATQTLVGTKSSGACKGWVIFTAGAGGATILASFNVTSVTRSAGGQYTVNWTTAFSTANYAYSLTGNKYNYFPTQNGIAAGSLTLYLGDTAGTPTDVMTVSVAAFGDQ